MFNSTDSLRQEALVSDKFLIVLPRKQKRWRLKGNRTELGVYSGKFECALAGITAQVKPQIWGLRLMKREQIKDCQRSA